MYFIFLIVDTLYHSLKLVSSPIQNLSMMFIIKRSTLTSGFDIESHNELVRKMTLVFGGYPIILA